MDPGNNTDGQGAGDTAGYACESSRSRAEIMADLARSVETWDMTLVRNTVNEALAADIPPADITRDGLGKGMDRISKLFDEAKIFLPQIVAASKAMDLALELIGPSLTEGNGTSIGTIVMGSVRGDIHEIGKDVCCAMLKGAGYKVIDLGPDQAPERFVEGARKHCAMAIGASALMTTTLVVQKEIVVEMRKDGSSAKVLVGGAPCCQQWADEIGADGYSANGSEIVNLVRSFV